MRSLRDLSRTDAASSKSASSGGCAPRGLGRARAIQCSFSCTASRARENHSWLSERLIPALPAVRIRSDVERKRLAGLQASDSAATGVRTGIYSPEFAERTYLQLLEHTKVSLRSGFTTIVDATFLAAKDRRAFLTLAQQLDIPAAIVACEAKPDVLEDRIRARARGGDRISDADLDVLKAQLASSQPFAPGEENLLVRTNTSEANAVTDTVRALRTRAPEKY
jgi:predicted kinase